VTGRRQAGRLGHRLEGIPEVRAGQGGRPAHPVRTTLVVLPVERTAPGLLVEVRRQILAADDALEVLTEQQSLGAVAAGIIVQDAALKALIDEGGVTGVGGRSRDRRAPDLEIDQREEVLLAVAIREG